jgi:hypothetical protein
LLDEHHATPPLLFSPTPHIKPEVDLRVAAIKRKRDSQHSGIPELEPHYADQMFALPGVQLNVPGQVPGQQTRVYLIVQQHQVSPGSC